MEEKVKLITVLIGITLAVVVVNLYGIFSLLNANRNLGAGVDVIAEEIDVNGRPEPLQPVPSTGTVPLALPQEGVSADDDPFKGSATAPVTMIEFSDFQCPFCKRFFDQTLSQIEENYINTGKVKFVYRDFPLGGHKDAQKAAEAGECADEQGKFWEIHDKIFENQTAMGVDDLKRYAAEIGLNTSQFNSCLDSGQMAAEVKKDFDDGASYGVTGTPSFFINGVNIKGAQPFSVFQQAIEQALSQ